MTSSNSPAPRPASAKGFVGGAGFLLFIGAVSGLLHEWFGWIRLFGFLRFLLPTGQEVFGYAVMAVLGLALCASAERLGRRAR
ncbi:hypothetical protein [Streptomyces sp. NPDC089799]|uniref:hypothetical protein n=1 Tax=Streptomyces sp. NPDC089799 TaxID=3155066 RepID=UPI003441DE7B